MTGIEISSTTTSGCRASAAWSAAAPSVATPTTSHSFASTALARNSIAGLSSTRRTRTNSDDVVLDGILHELGGCLETELFHHPVLVKGDRSRGEFQHARHLLHRTALGEQLQHFPLARGELV